MAHLFRVQIPSSPMRGRVSDSARAQWQHWVWRKPIAKCMFNEQEADMRRFRRTWVQRNPTSNTHTGVLDVDPMDRQERSTYLRRSDLMPLATSFARSSDIKSEVSRGHSRGNLKGLTLTTRVEVRTLMTNSSGPQNNALEGGCHDAKRAEQRSVVYGKRRSS